MIRFDKNPWFSLGIHVDHKAPYVAFHLPGGIITVGRLEAPWFTRTLNDDLLLISPNRIDPECVQKLKKVLDNDQK